MIPKLLKQRSLSNLLGKIERANDLEITQIIRAIIKRYSKIYPDQEVIFLSLPVNDPKERDRTLASAFELFSKQT